MSAAELHDLDEHLVDVLAPEGAPSDDDIIRADDDPDGETAPEAERVTVWRPEDEGAADWVARKAKRAAEQLATKQAQRDRIVAQADAWLVSERRPLDSTIAWAEGLLAEWLRAEIDADPKGKKSRELPCGVTIRRTAGRQVVEVTDVDAFRDFAEGRGLTELLRVKVEPDKRALGKLPTVDEQVVTDDGEPIPGVSAVTNPDSYKLDTGDAS